MRIIAGEFRGRKLLGPEGDVTRPITDRVKQSLFDILTPRITGSRVYDLFAGTGSMGLESLSRGAEEVMFFESDRGALARLGKNISTLSLEDRSQVIAGDLFKWFSTAAAGVGANVIFLDPPYRFLKEHPDKLRELASTIARSYLAEGGLIVFRHDAEDELELPSLRAMDRREYGNMALEFLIRK